MGQVEPEKGFLFYEDIGRPLNQAAFSLRDFLSQIRVVPIGSINFHQGRKDFSRWIAEVLHDSKLAKKIEELEVRGEELRIRLIEILNRRIEELEGKKARRAHKKRKTSKERTKR